MVARGRPTRSFLSDALASDRLPAARPRLHGSTLSTPELLALEVANASARDIRGVRMDLVPKAAHWWRPIAFGKRSFASDENGVSVSRNLTWLAKMRHQTRGPNRAASMARRSFQ